MELNINQIQIDERNKYYGVYIDEIFENLYCIIDITNEQSIIIINLYAKYFIKINLNTKKFNAYIFDIDIANPSDIKKYINIGILKEEGIVVITNTTFELTFFSLKKIYTKNISNILNILDLKILINNKNIDITRGGTRKIYLLDNIVIKERDPNCSVECEQITNYFSQSYNINIVKIIGLIKYNEDFMIVEDKHIPIDWSICLRDHNIYIKYKEMFDKLVQNIGIGTIIGDFNLSNILKEKDTDSLIITDFNGTYPEIFLRLNLITNIEDAKTFRIRLSDYLTDERIREKIGIHSFTNIYVFVFILRDIFEGYENLTHSYQKYSKYKQKYLKYKLN